MKRYIFLLVFILLTLFGTSLTGFTLGIWILDQNTSAFAFSLISFFALAPQVLLGPLTGSFVDKVSKKRIIIIGQIAAGIGTLVLISLFKMDILKIWHIIVVVFFGSICNGLIKQAYYVSTISLVPKKKLNKAKAMEQIGMAMISILVPIISPILYKLINLEGVFLVDLFTFVVSIIVFSFFKLERNHTKKSKNNFIRNTTVAFQFLRKKKEYILILKYYFFINLALGTVSLMLIPLILDFSDETTLSIVMFCSGIGILSGGILISSRKGLVNPNTGMIKLNIVIGLILFLSICFYVNTLLLSVAVYIIMLLGTIINISINTFWQVVIPEELQGRILGYRTLIMGGAVPLSYLLGGGLIDFLILPILNYLSQKGYVWAYPNKTIAILVLFCLMGIITMIISYKVKNKREILKLDILYNSKRNE